MLIVFLLDINGIILIKSVPQSQTVNQQYNIEALPKTRSVEQTTRVFCTKTTTRCKMREERHYCSLAFTVPTRCRTMQLDVSKSKNCIAGKGKNDRLTKDDDT